MKSQVYCLYTDQYYLPRALALIDSLRELKCNDEIWVCALSKECWKKIGELKLKNVVLIGLTDLESEYPKLLDVKKNRSALEYFFTCTPLLIEYVFKHSIETKQVVYVDSDIWFFDNPSHIFDVIKNAPITIIPHNFAKRSKWRSRYGLFNVGWVSFKRSEEGLNCLAWWRDRCLEWCSADVEGDRYADQRYLDQFPWIAPHTKILTHKGCNTAPWNIENYKIQIHDGRVFVDEDPLIFFHFHGLRKSLWIFYFDCHRMYGAPYTPIIRNYIYRPYIEQLIAEEARLHALPDDNGKTFSSNPITLNFNRTSTRPAGRREIYYQLRDLIVGRAFLAWPKRDPRWKTKTLGRVLMN